MKLSVPSRIAHRPLALLPAAGFAAALGLAAPAEAHFKLSEPTSWIVENATGDPQKLGPCGTTVGTRTNVVTQVKPGSKLMLRWTETIFHPGHFRVAIAADRSMLTDPVVNAPGGSCISAAIQTNPTLPVVADGLFPRTSGQSGKAFETEITVPNMLCDKCTLQIIQFMSSHGAPCLYYHCADLKITDNPVNPDGGATITVDASAADRRPTGGDGAGSGGTGTGGSADGAAGAPGGTGSGGAGTAGGSGGAGAAGAGGNAGMGGSAAGGASVGGAGASSGSGGAGGASPTGTSSSRKTESGGCSLAGHTAAPPVALGVLGLALGLSRLRRRR